MQHSDIPTVGIYFDPIFSKECDISQKDYEDLQRHIFSRIPKRSREIVKQRISQECNFTITPYEYTKYIFRITDFKKDDRDSVIDTLRLKLPFVSKKLLGNEQHVYQITIKVCKKGNEFFHLWLTVQTDTQVKNQKKLKQLDEEETKISLLRVKRKEDKKSRLLVAQVKAQNTRYFLGKLEAQPYVVGDSRDFDALNTLAS